MMGVDEQTNEKENDFCRSNAKNFLPQIKIDFGALNVQLKNPCH